MASWEKEAKKFFPFKEGTVTLYAGRTKKIFSEEWIENGKTFRSVVLKVKENKETSIEALLLNEILTEQDQYTAEQTLERWSFSSKGIEIQREVVFNQPSPGNYLFVGKQEPYQIAKLPFQEGNSVNGYKIVTTSAEIRAPLQKFKETVRIQGIVENFSFAADFGMVSREIYDEQWIVKERILPFVGKEKLEPKEQASLVRQIKSYCKKNGFHFKSALSFTVKELNPSPKVITRTLVYRREKKEQDQKRIQIMEQEWLKTIDGKKYVWQLIRQI